MRLAWITTGVLVAGLAVVGCSSSSQDKTNASTANIQGGTADTTHKFAVGIRSQTGLCSGALILPNLVATARHCVSESPERIDCSKNPTFGKDKTGFYVTTNSTVNGNPTSAGWYKAKSIYRPSDNHVCGFDIALIVLEKSVPATEATPITPGVQHVMWDSRFVPSFTAIGYGRTAPDGVTGEGATGVRRILDLLDVRCVPGSNSDAVQDCPAVINAREFVGGDGICQGDSGSSAYESSSFQAGDPVSFGVLSRGGASPDGTQCQGSIYTRFDAHRDWVLDIAKVASSNWSLYPEPAWTAYVAPPPGKTPAPDPGTTKPNDSEDTKASLGEACSRNKDCSSNLCVTYGEDKFCSKSCEDDENSCGKGYECVETLCVKAEKPAKAPEETPAATAPAAAPQTQTVTTTTCSAAPGSAAGSSAAWLVGVAVALAALRRRRSEQASNERSSLET